ncbi:MAG: hypothetical protein ACM359_15560, partial [Bacillota bacterium]
MPKVRQVKTFIWLGLLLTISVLLTWIALQPGIDVGNRANNSASSPTTQLARLPLDPQARQAALKRGIGDALRLAAAGNARESLQTIDRLIDALQAELTLLAKVADSAQPGSPEAQPVSIANTSAPTPAAAERITLDLDRRALQLVQANIRLKVNEISDPQWLGIYGAAANTDPQSFDRVLEQLLLLSGPHWPADRLWMLLNARLPAAARALLATHLAAYQLPDDKADLQQCSQFYETLIARCIDTPVVAEGLLERYIQELDRRDATAVANAFLWNLLKLLPDSRPGAKAATLLLAAEASEARGNLLRHLWATYPASEVAKAIRTPYLELLSRERQFVRIFQLLDDQHTIPLATTSESLASTLGDLAHRCGRSPSLAFSRRRIVPAEPSPGLLAIHPFELCAGLVEEITGQPVDASELESDAQPATQAIGADPLKASLLAFLNRAFAAIPLNRAQQSLLADLNHSARSPSTQPFAKPVSQPGYELAWQANFLKAAGKVPDALRLCRQSIESPPDRDTRLQARRILIELLLDQQPLDALELDRQFAALKADENGLTSASWNLAIRALFRRVLASSPSDQQTVWNRTLEDLRQHPWPLVDQTLTDLDRFTQDLNGQALSPLAATTDLLLLSSDIPTMARLQSRRVSLMLAGKAWDDVVNAIQLHTILACFTQDGPFDWLNRDLELARTAGMPADRIQKLQVRAQMILPSISDPSAPLRITPIDAPLRQASQALLRNSPNLHAGFGATRRPGSSAAGETPCSAFAHAFAGDPAVALRTLHASLDQASTTNDALDCFDDIAVVLAVADGSTHLANRFTQWLAERRLESGGADTPVCRIPPGEGRGEGSPPGRNETSTTRPAPTSQRADPLLALLQECEVKAQTLGVLENETRHDASLGAVPTTAPFRELSIAPAAIRSELANASLRRWGQRAVAWGVGAIRQDATSVAEAAWALALNTQRHPASAAALAELMVARLRGASPDTDRLKILESMLPHLCTERDRQLLHTRIISLHRQEGTQLA